MTLAEKLNKFKINSVVHKGKVTLECEPDDDQLNPDGTLVDPEQDQFVDEMESFEAYLEVHPEGRGGGYVPYVVEINGERAWFDENGDNEWFSA